MSISAKELATLLNLSPSAVSLALNGKNGISQETREKVLSAAEAHGLKRTHRKSSKSLFVTLIIYKKHGMICSETDFFSAVIEGISRQAAATGYSLQVSYFYGDHDLKEQMHSLRLSDSAGFILLATEMLEEDILLFQDFERPIVVLDSNFLGFDHDCVVINNTQGAFLATQYLLDHGHRNLGHIASSVRINNFTERTNGMSAALANVDNCTVTTTAVAPTQEGAYQDMSAFLDTSPILPTAYFVDNDIIAVSCIRALKEHHYKIPEDVSIVSFDDMPIAYVTSPKLTTIHVEKEELGRCAVLRLAEIISGSAGASITIAINTSLCERSSVRTIN